MVNHIQQAKIPFVCVTNDGGNTEEGYAEDLNKILGTNLSGDQVILSHTPLKPKEM